MDDRGRVILLRYGDSIQSYSQEITHELVHAFRRHSGHLLSGFIEEGFAEVVAMAANPDDNGFPRYGYPLTIVAGHLVARNEHLPLGLIRAQHAELNRRCQLQAYVERASFFEYLTKIASLDALVRFVYGPAEPTDDDYAAFFGGGFTGSTRGRRTCSPTTVRFRAPKEPRIVIEPCRPLRLDRSAHHDGEPVEPDG